MTDQTTADGVRYCGKRIPDSSAGRIYRVEPDGTEVELDLRLDLRNASPTGFNWGYPGSGPMQAAVAILADAYDDDTAVRNAAQFKDKFLADLDMDAGFILHQDSIPEYLPGVDL